MREVHFLTFAHQLEIFGVSLWYVLNGTLFPT